MLPGGVTLLVPNPAQALPARLRDTPDALGLRVPALGGALAPLAAVSWPVLQSSANRSGDPEARRIEDVDPAVSAGVDLVLDGGELPGTPSTVVDLAATRAMGASRSFARGPSGGTVWRRVLRSSR